jgi:hypothetical protein
MPWLFLLLLLLLCCCWAATRESGSLALVVPSANSLRSATRKIVRRAITETSRTVADELRGSTRRNTSWEVMPLIEDIFAACRYLEAAPRAEALLRLIRLSPQDTRLSPRAVNFALGALLRGPSSVHKASISLLVKEMETLGTPISLTSTVRLWICKEDLDFDIPSPWFSSVAFRGLIGTADSSSSAHLVRKRPRVRKRVDADSIGRLQSSLSLLENLERTGKLDFHGASVAAALQAVKAVVHDGRHNSGIPIHDPQQGPLVLISGQGLHSPGGPKVGPAVRYFLRQEGVAIKVPESNPGVILATL